MNRLSRLTPLTGLAFAALFVVATAGTPNNPNAKASGARVIAFINAHHSGELVGAVVGTLAMVSLIAFAGRLYDLVRTTNSRTLGIVALVGAGLIGAGFLVSGSIVWALVDGRSHLSASAAQALNALDYDMFLPMVGGIILFAISTGVAVLREGWLPAWLGWVLIVLGVIAPSPAFPLAVFGIAAWSAVVAVILTGRARRPAAAPARLGGATA